MIGMVTRSRAFSKEALKVVNDVAKQQFLISMQGAEAVIGYEANGKQITLVHTNVPSEFQGKGVGKILAEHAFEHAQKNKLDVTCKCHFLANYYKNNNNKYKDINIKFELEDEEQK